ncbi:hypothetical protein IV203_007520 [Nitzschia inconspicua]|uniref:Uncharacterized protein n=1 Tax=Nitzschia inconspicua TaxID=303405 RepID=A0A9K3KFA3_9STRA|nr:hypothetical protein IV203_007520 [Nitzschia inconspicua]
MTTTPPPPSSSSTASSTKGSGFSSVLSTFLHSIQNRRWLALQQKAQKLDATTQNQLHGFLRDHLGNKEEGDKYNNNNNNDDDDDDDTDSIPDDYEILQKEIDRAYEQQESLEKKKQFLSTRLETYQAKLRALEVASSSTRHNDDDNDDEQKKKQHRQSQQKKIVQLKAALQPVKELYMNMEYEMKRLHQQISSMHQRQMELKIKTQECKAVLQELEYNSMVAGTADMTISNRQGTSLEETTETDEENGCNLLLEESSPPTPLEVEPSLVLSKFLK